MKLTKSRLIDKDATSLLTQLLPTSWLIRKQDPDLGIDYVVEIADEADGPLGTNFCIQQKGTKSPKYTLNGKTISMPLERDYIEYYLDKVRQPVFLIIVDLTRKEAYWLFMQKWAREDQLWRQKKKPTVKISANNKLSDTDGFLKAILMAEKYMREELWPSSIAGAIKGEKERREKLDPRISIVKVDVKDGIPIFCMEPLEPINITMELLKKEDSALQSKVKQVIELGSPSKFTPDEVRIHGLEIFDDPTRIGVEIDSVEKIDSELRLISVDSEGRELESLSFPGKTSRGIKGGHFLSDPGKLPVRASVPFLIEDEVTNIDFTATFFVSPKVWEGLSVSRLPYFDKLESFLRSVEANENVKLEYRIEGLLIFSSPPMTLNQSFVQSLALFMGILNRARTVARRFQKPLRVPDLGSVSQTDLQDLDYLYELAEHGAYREGAEGRRFSAIINFNEEGLERLSGIGDGWISVRVGHEMTYSVFGTEIPVIVLLELTKARFQGDLSSVEHVDKNSSEEGTSCAWIGAPDSELIVKLLDTDSD